MSESGASHIIIIIAAVIAVAMLALAFVLYRRAWSRRRRAAPVAPIDTALEPVLRRRYLWDLLRFMAGPLPISISIHVLVLLALLWGVHLETGRNLITVDFRAGGGGGGTDELKQLQLPEMPMPEARAPLPIERPVVASPSSTAINSPNPYVRSAIGSR